MPVSDLMRHFQHVQLYRMIRIGYALCPSPAAQGCSYWESDLSHQRCLNQKLMQPMYVLQSRHREGHTCQTANHTSDLQVLLQPQSWSAPLIRPSTQVRPLSSTSPAAADIHGISCLIYPFPLTWRGRTGVKDVNPQSITDPPHIPPAVPTCRAVWASRGSRITARG